MQNTISYFFRFWGQMRLEHVLYRPREVIPVKWKRIDRSRLTEKCSNRTFLMVYSSERTLDCCQMWSACVCILQMEVLVLCVTLMDMIIAAVLIYWFYREKRDHKKWRHLLLLIQTSGWMCLQYLALWRLSSSFLRRFSNNNRIQELKKGELTTTKFSSLMMPFLRFNRGSLKNKL